MAVLAMEQAREVSQEASTVRLAFPGKAPCSPSSSRLAELANGAPALQMTAFEVLDAQVMATRYFKSEDMRDSLSGLKSGSGVTMLELGLSNEQERNYARPGAVQCSSQDESNGQTGSTNVDRDRSSLLKSAGEEEHKERCEANTPHGIQEPSTEVVHKDLTGLLLSAAREEAGDAKKDVVSEGVPAEDQQDEGDDDDEQNGDDEEDAGDNNGDKNNGNNDNNEGEEEGEEEEYAAEDEDEEDEDDDDEAEGARAPPRRKFNVNTKAIEVGDTDDEDDEEAEPEPEPPKKRVKN